MSVPVSVPVSATSGGNPPCFLLNKNDIYIFVPHTLTLKPYWDARGELVSKLTDLMDRSPDL